MRIYLSFSILNLLGIDPDDKPIHTFNIHTFKIFLAPAVGDSPSLSLSLSTSPLSDVHSYKRRTPSMQLRPNLVQVTGLLHVPPRGQKWESEKEAKDSPPAHTKWDLGGLNLERQVGVETLLWGTVNVAHGSGRGLESSGGSWGSQSDSGNH